MLQLTAFLKLIEELNTSLVFTCPYISLLLFQFGSFSKFQDRINQVLTNELSAVKKARHQNDKYRATYEAATQRIKHHEKGKVKLEKLVELETDAEQSKKSFKSSSDEVFRLLKVASIKCSWDILYQFCDFVMEPYSVYFEQGTQLSTNDMIPALQDIRQKVDQVCLLIFSSFSILHLSF